MVLIAKETIPIQKENYLRNVIHLEVDISTMLLSKLMIVEMMNISLTQNLNRRWLGK
jgi:hypothetical protein